MRQLPEYRIYVTPQSRLRRLGCIGCLIFVVGGLVGMLLFGWKMLLGL